MAHETYSEAQYKNGGEISGGSYSGDTQKEGGGYCNSKADEKEVRILVDFITNELNQAPSSPSKCTIYQVLQPLREVKPEAYIPRLFSIGPFHRYSIHLWPMEAHKLRLLNHFLNRRSHPTLDDYVREMWKLEKEARQCYSEVFPLKRDEFVRMMVVDGCFLLELIFMWKEHEDKKWKERKYLGSKDPDEPIFNRTWMPQIIRDLLLLENQLPFSVLECLYMLHTGDSGYDALYDSTGRFLKDLLHLHQTPQLPKEGARHLLDYVRHLLVSPAKEDKEKRSERTQCATELKAIIKFEKSETECISDITFEEGVLRIPAIKIDDLAESLLRNLIAMEQSPKYDAKYVTAYAVFMRDLIKSPEDVNLLQDKEIFESLIKPEEVLALFNNLLKEVTRPHDLCFSHVYNKLEEYCNKPFNRSVEKLLRSIETLETTYFKNTWSIISFLAATVLLGLTMAQPLLLSRLCKGSEICHDFFLLDCLCSYFAIQVSLA